MIAEEPARSPPRMNEDGKPVQKGIPYHRRHVVTRTLLSLILLLVVLAGVTALVLYLVYRPSKPSFTVVGAAVYVLNVTNYPIPIVFSSFQVTVTVRNPNIRSAISYDRMTAYVTFRGQPITPPTRLPPLDLRSESTVVMSPMLGGGAMGVPPDVAQGLVATEAYGLVALRLVVVGRIKYRPGPFHSARVGLFVNCDMMVGYPKGHSGQVPLLASAGCSVET